MDNKKWGPGNFISNLMGKKEGSVKETVSKSGDGLNTWHEDQQVDNEGFELTEDDLLVVQNDPKFKEWEADQELHSEQFSADRDGLDSFIASDAPLDAMEEPFDGYKDEYKDGYEAGPISGSDLSFEEQDLTQEWKKTADAKKQDDLEQAQDERVRIKFSPRYHVNDFSLMEQCATYVEEAFVKGKRGVTRPTFGNGGQMSTQSINELMKEYRSFKAENPQEYADMKVKLGDWKSHQFNWESGERNGRPQWKSVEKGRIFISWQNPARFTHKGDEYYFTTGKPFMANKTEMYWVDLQMPAKKEKAQ